jgi:phosphoglycolate phosphatase-like HAD superfamily hydrolase
VTGRKLEGLLIDIDGTLTDSNDLHAEAWQEAFRHFGADFPYDEIRGLMGKGGDLLIPDLLSARQMRQFGDEVGKYRKKLFQDRYMPRVRPFPRVPETFAALAELGIRLALASSSDEDEVKYYTGLLKIEQFIQKSTSKKDAEHSKPSPEIFKAALDGLGTDETLTATVGDTPWDIIASHRIPLPAIGILSGGFEEEALRKAEFLFERVDEIPGRIDEVNAYFNE